MFILILQTDQLYVFINDESENLYWIEIVNFVTPGEVFNHFS
jgi:hypothetical protein